MSDSSPIQVGVPSDRERRRRRREILLAFGAAGAIALLTWVELRNLGVDSYLFLALFNLNFILLLLVLVLVLRNGVKLMLERRRRMLGSRLRSRLVAVFISLSLIPTALMFLVSLKFVQTSVDYWFKNRVEKSMEEALDLGQEYYASVQAHLKRAGLTVVSRLEGGVPAQAAAQKEFLERESRERGLSFICLLGPDRAERAVVMQDVWRVAWPETLDKLDWKSLHEQGGWSGMVSTPRADLVLAVFPLPDGRGYLAAGETLGKGVAAKLDQVVKGIDEYKKLKTLKHPLKVALYLILLVMTLLIVFGAMWFGFRVAKEISAPVQALALGTERVARGDYDVRLEDCSSDELGLLVRSFNSMAEDLGESRRRLTEANIVLERQNRELEARGRYMEAVLDNIAAGVISIDADGRISTVNRAAEAMLGVDGGALAGKRPEERLQGVYKSLLADALARLETSPGSQWQRQLDLSYKDRELKLLVNVVALQSDGDESEEGGAGERATGQTATGQGSAGQGAAGQGAVAFDPGPAGEAAVSAAALALEGAAEEAGGLARAEERQEAGLATVSEASVGMSAETEAPVEASGKTLGEASAEAPADGGASAPESSPASSAPLMVSVATGPADSADSAASSDAAGEASQAVPPSRPRRSAGLVAVFEDVTELEKTQRLSAWREVARRIAHEIKNPLTPIKLSAQRLERRFGPLVGDPVFNQCTSVIVRHVEHMQRMVQEFSAFAKLPEVAPRPGRLEPLVEEVAALFAHSHGRIEWQVDVAKGLPRFSFDKEALRRVLINLLTNACEVLRDQAEARVRLAVSYDRRHGMVRLEVADNGPGLPDEERHRLFEPYFSRKEGGAGLGLTIVKSIVSDHRGFVRALPNPPRGALFVVELPV